MPGVRVFIDYQNVHLTAHETFAPHGTPVHKTLIHPARLADVMNEQRHTKGRTAGTIDEVHVYRGQPSSKHEPNMAARNKAQAAEWSRDRRVKMHTRPLRYPRNWPEQKPKEKGVDVMLACDFVRAAIECTADVLILASRDTDMLPALEMARDLSRCQFEVISWQGASRLRFSDGSPLWCTHLTGADYVKSRDLRRYE